MRKSTLYLLAALLALIVFGIISIRIYTGKVVAEESVHNSYSLKEISIHNSLEDCWIFSGESVYDITPLVDNKNFFSSDCGKEKALNDYFQELLNNKYKIGVVG